MFPDGSYNGSYNGSYTVPTRFLRFLQKPTQLPLPPSPRPPMRHLHVLSLWFLHGSYGSYKSHASEWAAPQQAWRKSPAIEAALSHAAGQAKNNGAGRHLGICGAIGAV